MAALGLAASGSAVAADADSSVVRRGDRHRHPRGDPDPVHHPGPRRRAERKDPEDLDLQPVGDTLAQLIPSFNVQKLPTSDGLQFVRPASLRNLSPDETLVLVNGKRFHRSAFLLSRGAQAPDLAQIPSFAIRHVEVLRDGASAQYGSDANAGVINIILDERPGFSGYAQGSQFYEGDGKTYQLGARAGFKLGDGGHLALTAEYTDAGLTSRSRQRADAIAFQAANPTIKIDNRSSAGAIRICRPPASAPTPACRWGPSRRPTASPPRARPTGSTTSTGASRRTTRQSTRSCRCSPASTSTASIRAASPRMRASTPRTSRRWAACGARPRDLHLGPERVLRAQPHGGSSSTIRSTPRWVRRARSPSTWVT